MVNHIGEVMFSIVTLSVQWSNHIGEVMVSVYLECTVVNHIGEIMVSIFTLSVQWFTTSVR